MKKLTKLVLTLTSLLQFMQVTNAADEFPICESGKNIRQARLNSRVSGGPSEIAITNNQCIRMAQEQNYSCYRLSHGTSWPGTPVKSTCFGGTTKLVGAISCHDIERYCTTRDDFNISYEDCRDEEIQNLDLEVGVDFDYYLSELLCD